MDGLGRVRRGRVQLSGHSPPGAAGGAACTDQARKRGACLCVAGIQKQEDRSSSWTGAVDRFGSTFQGGLQAGYQIAPRAAARVRAPAEYLLARPWAARRGRGQEQMGGSRVLLVVELGVRVAVGVGRDRSVAAQVDGIEVDVGTAVLDV